MEILRVLLGSRSEAAAVCMVALSPCSICIWDVVERGKEGLHRGRRYVFPSSGLYIKKEKWILWPETAISNFAKSSDAIMYLGFL